MENKNRFALLRRYFALLFFLALCYQTYGQGHFHIEGKIIDKANNDGSFVMLELPLANKMKKGRVKNGKFTIKGKVNFPERCFLSWKNNDTEMVLERGSYHVNITGDSINISTNSYLHNTYYQNFEKTDSIKQQLWRSKGDDFLTLLFMSRICELSFWQYWDDFWSLPESTKKSPLGKFVYQRLIDDLNAQKSETYFSTIYSPTERTKMLTALNRKNHAKPVAPGHYYIYGTVDNSFAPDKASLYEGSTVTIKMAYHGKPLKATINKYGEFRFKGKAKYPQKCYIYYGGTIQALILDNAEYNLNIRMEETATDGLRYIGNLTTDSHIHNTYFDWSIENKKALEQMDSLRDQLKTATNHEAQQIRQTMSELANSIDSSIYEKCKEVSDKHLVPLFLLRLYNMSYDKCFPIFESLPIEVKLSPTGKYLQKTILSYKNAGQVQYKLTK